MDILWTSFLLALLLWRSKPCKANEAWLGRDATEAVKGFFVGLVFFRHFAGYMAKGTVFRPVDAFLGQLIVVMFLFYSGYGTMTQFAKRGDRYIRDIPRKRILPTVVNFDVAVLVFLAFGALSGKTFGMRRIALSLLGWSDLGNSNWYIFAIVCAYAATWLAFGLARLAGGGKRTGAALLWALLAGYALVMSRHKPPLWFDTVSAFGLGAAFGLWPAECEAFIDRHWKAVLAAGSLGTLALVPPTFRFLEAEGAAPLSCIRWLWGNARALCFAAACLAATRKLRFSSPPLAWCGRNLFPLYIYQRLPMMAFAHWRPASLAGPEWFAFFLPCAVITVGIAFAFPMFRYPFARRRPTPKETGGPAARPTQTYGSDECANPRGGGK